MAKNTKTAKPSVTAEQVAEAFLAAINLANQYNGADATPAPVDEDEEEVEEDEEEVELSQEMIDTAAAEGIKSLRTLAQEVLGEDAPTKKADILAALGELVEGDEEEEDEEEEDEDDEVEEVEEDDDEADEDEEDEEEDDEEEEGYDRDSLEELDLKQLRAIAKEEGHKAAEYRGLDQDALVDLILGEDEVEEDEEEAEDEDEEVEELDEDALNEMSQKELMGLAKELGVKVPKALQPQNKKNHKKIVALILDSGEEE